MRALGNKAILSKNLKKYIALSGKDRRELAEIWGFPYSTVSEWVNGRKYPRIDRIEIMADYFGILKSDLIEEKPKAHADMQKNNDIIADIIVRMRTDEDFFEAVKTLHSLDDVKLAGVMQMLQAFNK